jgi:putative peptidoglycan lipid II flippase
VTDRLPSGEAPRSEDVPAVDITDSPDFVATLAHDVGSSDIETAATSSNMRAVVGRAAMIILLATVVGRVLGLLRDMVVASVFGAQATTDAFFLAYKIPYLLSLTVGGALTATFIPIFTQRVATGRREDAWKLSVSMTNATTIVLLGVTVVFMLLGPWIVPLFGPGFDPSSRGLAIHLYQILMPGVIFAGLAGLATGILNSLKRFGLAAFSASFGAIATIGFVVVFAHAWGISSLAWGTTVGAAVTFVVLVPQLLRQGMHYRPRVDWHMEGMAEVGLMVWPILIGSAVGKVSIFVDQVLGSLLGTGSISALNYSEKLFQMPLGLFVAGITIPIFPLLSEHVAAKQPERLKSTLGFAMRMIGVVLIPVSVGLIVLRTPLIAFLFQHGKFTAADTARTGSALLCYSIGLLSYAGRDTLTRVFYAYHDTRTPVKISVAAVGINIVCSYLLMHVIGVGGLAMGTTIALTVNFLVLIELLRRKIGPLGFRAVMWSFGRVLGASVVMGLVIWGVDELLQRSLPAGTVGMGARLCIGIVVGIGAFVAVAAIGRFPERKEIADMLRATVRRRR